MTPRIEIVLRFAGGMSKETGATKAAERLRVVMSCIQAIAIIVGLSLSPLLFIEAGYDGWEDDCLLITAIWGLGGCLIALLLAEPHCRWPLESEEEFQSMSEQLALQHRLASNRLWPQNPQFPGAYQ